MTAQDLLAGVWPLYDLRQIVTVHGLLHFPSCIIHDVSSPFILPLCSLSIMAAGSNLNWSTTEHLQRDNAFLILPRRVWSVLGSGIVHRWKYLWRFWSQGFKVMWMEHTKCLGFYCFVASGLFTAPQFYFIDRLFFSPCCVWTECAFLLHITVLTPYVVEQQLDSLECINIPSWSGISDGGIYT